MPTETKKRDCSTEPFTIDWSGVYQQLGFSETSDPITASVWSKTGDIVIDSFNLNGLLATSKISGGTAGETATLENKITIGSLGYEFCYKLIITVT